MKDKKILWGLFFLLIGGIVIVNKLGYLDVGNIYACIITLLLIPVFIKGILNVRFASILFPIAIVSILYSEELGITNLTPWPVLIAALCGSVGLSLIFGKGHFWHTHEFSESVSRDSSDDFDVDTSFNSVIKYISADNLKTGKIDCSFGGVKVYFDNAKLNENGAEIKIDLAFSGLELYIPKEWKVVSKVNVFAGGIEEKGIPTKTSDNCITLTGELAFSGITIIYI